MLLNRLKRLISLLRGLRRKTSSRRKKVSRGVGPEGLETRLCLSSFYTDKFEIIARTGNGLTSIQPAPSINDQGQVAFVASNGEGQSVYVADGPGGARIISFPSPSTIRTYGPEIQINNSGQVAAVDREGTDTVVTRARIWDANNAGDFANIIARGISPRPMESNFPFPDTEHPDFIDHFDVINTFTSIANDGQQAFAALNDTKNEIHLSSSLVARDDMLSLVSTMDTGNFYRFMAAEGDQVVVGSRNTAAGLKQIKLYDTSGFDDFTTIASTAESRWNDLGIRPGISDDGRIVSFYGDEAWDFDNDGIKGPGIFASVERATKRSLVRIASLADGFSSFAVDQRVSVSNMNEENCTASIVFQGADTDRKNGLFASQLKFQLDTTDLIVLDFNVGKPSSIVRQGETIPRLGIVNSVAIHDSVNNAGTATFWADTSGGQAIVRTKLPTQRVVLAWGHDVPVQVVELHRPSWPARKVEHLLIRGGSMPQFASSQTEQFNNFKELVRAQVQKQFEQSGVAGIEVINGAPQPGAVVVYFAFPIGAIEGMAYSGVDRFNWSSSGEAVVFITSTDLSDPGFDAQTITHEVGHSLGLRHIDPFGRDPLGDYEVMDYDRATDYLETFSTSPYVVTENLHLGGVATGITHNPTYHLRRYVDGISPGKLATENLIPGTWDLKDHFISTLEAVFSFDLSLGSSSSDTKLYNVYVTTSGGDGYSAPLQSLAYYESITFEDLSQRAFHFTKGDAISLIAASRPDGEYDISLASGESFVDSNLIIYPEHGINTCYLQIADSSAAGYSTLARVILVVAEQSPNLSPIATGEEVQTESQDAVEITVLSNDYDSDGSLSFNTLKIIQFPTNGTVSVNSATGTITYTPDLNFIGTDEFTYEVKDDRGAHSNLALVTLTVVEPPPGENLPPVAHAGGPYRVLPNSTVQLNGSGSTDPNEVASGLTYKWDLDGDYVFGETGADALRGDETGIRPSFDATGLSAQTSFDVALEVTDREGWSHLAQATVHIAPPPEILADGVLLNSVIPFNLGVTNPGGPALSQVITIRNGSSSPMTLGTVAIAGFGYSVTQPVTAVLAPGTSTHVTVTLSSATGGIGLTGVLTIPTSQPSGTTKLGLRGSVDNVPSVVGVTRLDNGTGPVRVAIDFSQPLTPGPANTASNFFIAGENGQVIPIASAVYSQSGSLYRVTLTAMSSSTELPTGDYRVRVNGAVIGSVNGSALASNRVNLISHQVWESIDVVTIGLTENGQLGVVDGPRSTGFAPPSMITQGDFNRDGVLDFASTSGFTSEIVIHYGRPGGGYQTTSFELEGPVPGLASNPTSIAAADWNLDGVIDLVVFDRNGSLEHGSFSRMHVLLNEGQGAFTAAPDTPITIDPEDVSFDFLSVADYTGDQLPDIVISGPVVNRNPRTGEGEGSIAVYSKDPFVGYSRKQVVSTDRFNWYPDSVQSIDLNNDGWLDLIAETTGYYLDEPRPVVFLGSPSGFVVGDDLEYGNYGGQVAAADFDNDGKMDLAIIHDNLRQGSGDGSVITLQKGDGQGHFSPQPNIIFNRRGVFLVTAGDIDLDGNVDLVLRVDPFEHPRFLTNTELSFWVIYGNGLGEFDTSGPMIPYRLTNNIAPGNYLLRDITGDGYPELTFGNQSTGQIGMLLNDGTGKLLPSVAGPRAPTATAFNAQHYESGIVVADLNRDGLPDQLRILGNTISTPNQAIDVLWGNSNGQFDLVSSINLATIGGTSNENFFGNTGFVKVGDLNHDGWLDLIVGSQNIYSGPLQVFLGVDGRQFVSNPALFIEAGYKTGIVSGELADFNGDGHLDLVSIIFNSNERFGFGVLFGDGTGKLIYSPATFQLMHGAGMQVPIVGDFNQDNKPDIAIGNAYTNGSPAKEILVYHGLGSGKFTLGQTILRSEWDQLPQLYLHDVNDDGYGDILSPNEGTRKLDFYLGSSSGQFTAAPELSFAIPYEVANLVIGDITGDGFDDIAMTQFSTWIPDFVTSIPIFAGDGTGRFAAAQWIETGSLWPQSLALVPTGGMVEAGSFSITRPVLQIPNGLLNISTTTVEDHPVAIHPQSLIVPHTDDPFRISVQVAPTHGAVSIQNNATPYDSSDDFFRYVPLMGYFGNDSFTYQVSDGRGGTATGTINITVRRENQAPVIQFSSLSLTYPAFESPTPLKIDSTATVMDVDSTNFEGGRLTVAITGGLNSATDLLDFELFGLQPGQFYYEYGGALTFANQIIGKLTSETPDKWLITFNANATVAVVQAALRYFDYVSYDFERTVAAEKTITYTLTDGDGGVTTATKTILLPAKTTVQSPVVTMSAANVIYPAGSMPITVDDAVTVTDADSANFAGGMLSIDFVTPISLDDRLAIRSQGTGTGQVNVSGLSVRIGTTVIGTYSGGFLDSSPLVIALNSIATPAAVQTLLRQVTFQNVSANPGPAAREIRFVVQDGTGGVSAPKSRTIAMSFVAQNLPPVITTSGASTEYSAGQPPVILDDGFFVDDFDSPNFNGGNLTVDFLSGLASADRLAIRNEGTGLGQINLSDNTVRFGTIPIGTYSGGFDSSAVLTITFNENASPVRVELLMRQLTFHITSTNPVNQDRVLRLVLSDGDGGVSAPIMKTVTIREGSSGNREAPSVQLPSNVKTFSKLGPAVAIDSQAIVLAPDVGTGTIGGGVLTISINDVNTGKKKLDSFNLASLNSVGTSRGTQLVNGRLVTVFDLDPGLTASILQNALRGVTFQTSKKGLKFTMRSVQIQLADSQGDVSATVTKTINVSKKRIKAF